MTYRTMKCFSKFMNVINIFPKLQVGYYINSLKSYALLHLMITKSKFRKIIKTMVYNDQKTTSFQYILSWLGLKGRVQLS